VGKGLGIERTKSEIALLRSLEFGTSVSATCLLARYLLAYSSTILSRAPRILLLKNGPVSLSFKQEV
jgi:hypothetical protein